MRIFDLIFSDEDNLKMRDYVTNILDRGFLTNDRFVNRFEKEYALWNRSPWAIAASSGTAAIEMALNAVGVAGKKVIVPTNTFIATAIAIINAGATPVVIDIGPDYMGISPGELSKAIQKHDEIAAVCHVHIGGHISVHFQEVLEICRKNQIPLVEDACQSIGAEFNGRKAGNFGRFGCYSFFTTKNMTTGEGGMVVYHEESDRQKLESIRQFGKSSEDSTLHIGPGSNYKMNEFSAALGVIELQRIDSRIARRREIAQRYQHHLRDSHYNVFKDKEGLIGSYYKQIITSDIVPRTQIEKFLLEREVHLTGGVYHLPLHKQPKMSPWIKKRVLKNADWFADHHFCPPCYPELTNEQIDVICEYLLTLERSYL